MMQRLLPLLALVLACAPADPDPTPDSGPEPLGPRSFTVLHTSDEHGTLFPTELNAGNNGGAAELLGFWGAEGAPSPDHLVLSSGDLWMGGLESTLLEGEPTIEAMNRMGYAAAALGNHELDQGQAVLADRMAQAEFPILAANVEVTAPSTLAFEPFVLVRAGEVQVGVVGLGAPSLTRNATPENQAGLGLRPLAAALEDAIAGARAAGAEVIIVLVHESFALVERELGEAELSDPPDLWFGGHAHAVGVETLQGAPFVESGDRFLSYSRVTIDLDEAGAVTVGAPELVTVTDIDVEAPPPDAELAAYLAGVEAELSPVFDEVIGFTDLPLPRGSPIQGNWILDSWRRSFPEIELAVQQPGGLRVDLAAGPITVGDVLEVVPFPNDVVIFDIRGADLREVLRSAIAGCLAPCLYFSGGAYERTGPLTLPEVRLDDGSALDDEATYRVATNSFIFEGGSDFLWPEYATNVYETAILYSDPAIELTRALSGEANRSLFDVVDGSPRHRVEFLDALGFLDEEQPATGWPLANLVADAWLAADPAADLAVGCAEQLEHPLDAGALTLGELTALYPWSDNLVARDTTGAELREMLLAATLACPYDDARCFPMIAGGAWDASGGAPVPLIDDAVVAEDATVRVVAPSGLFQGSCGGGLALQGGDILEVRAFDALRAHVEAAASTEGSPLALDELARGVE